ncbi:uncharacterized protein LOC114881955 [Osmia bicornis bicornis]|uniref:uncharacterized protein LOC114881955 n=1 Tax=Osmia bicornis bicornis TaxID=1437191 RepID=UPI001EAF499F|nr:uncharacterized protein LOC114881955 [Osmia bicornis bicornis]
MYRQFLVRDEDRKYQQILWRDEANQVHTYQLKTVTFGLSAAPYLAIRCLTQLAHDEGHKFPHAAKAVGNQHEALLNDLPKQSINKKLHLGESSTLKTLGVVWKSSEDSITYEVKTQMTTRITKRFIASEIAKIYDPLGLLGPVIIEAKIILQKIWSTKVDWDGSLPMDIHTEWVRYYKQLPLLNNIIFQRKTIIDTPTKIELHGFCDASEKAYGACVYIRSTDPNRHTHTELLFAKSKVAPLKTQSIPRLELCGALLLTSLITTAKKALHVEIHNTTLWTDSTIVLNWLQTSPHLLKTFVANRVSEIQTKTNNKDWRHVPTSDNPADLISRGQTPEEFLRPSIWHHGPKWLTGKKHLWPTNEFAPCDIIEEPKTVTCLNTTPVDTSIFDNYSSWEKMQRITARCLRWKKTNTEKGTLTVSELRNYDASPKRNLKSGENCNASVLYCETGYCESEDD